MATFYLAQSLFSRYNVRRLVILFKNDKIKEEIGWLKVIFAILLATDISLIAWLVLNYGKVNPALFLIGALAAILLTFLNILINRITQVATFLFT